MIKTDTEEEWHAARRQGITASEIAVVMGLAPGTQNSPYALYHRKLQLLPEPEDSTAMELGRFLESWVAGRFQDLYPEFFLAGDGRDLFAHRERPWQLATPDKVIFDTACTECGQQHCAWNNQPVAVLECKTSATRDGWGEDGSDEIPVHYRCQVLWQMDVMGVSTGYVACLFLATRQVRVYEITLDSLAGADLELMRQEAVHFRGRLETGSPPEVDWTPATAAALKHLHPGLEDREVVISGTLARQYKAACRAVDRADRRKALAVNRIRARLGNGRYVLDRDGQPVATRQVYGVKAHLRKAATVDKLVPAKPPKEPAP
jgi:putative phage-type endonuclease